MANLPLLRNEADLNFLESNPTIVQIFFPLTDDRTPSGVPAHTSLMVSMKSVQEAQQKMMTDFCGKVKEALTDFGVNAAHLTKEQFILLVDELRKEIKSDVERIERSVNAARHDQMDVVQQAMAPVNRARITHADTEEGHLHIKTQTVHRVPDS